MKTISDVIAELEGVQQECGDLPVLVDGYEGGYEQPMSIKVVEVADRGAAAAEEQWWNGRYEDTEWSPPHRPRFDAVVIPR